MSKIYDIRIKYILIICINFAKLFLLRVFFALKWGMEGIITQKLTFIA
jgi:hypothetical protein